MQMKNMKWLLAGAALAVSGAATAGELSGTVTATSDYDFRGVTQSSGEPALQASIDWAADSGLYLGAWASNVDFGPGDPADVEVDVYAGFAGGVEDGLGYDVGAVYYTYPGASDYDYPEVYAGLSYGMFEAKIWYSWDGFATGESSLYYEGNASLPLPNDFGLAMHVGYSDGNMFDKLEGFQSYFDYSIGITKSLGHFDLELKWVDGSDWKDLNNTDGDVLSSNAKIVFSVATTFPWGE
jgi:uncharacterized protein (TIGR02001 family)